MMFDGTTFHPPIRGFEIVIEEDRFEDGRPVRDEGKPVLV
jgi:hypothetical protein